MDDLKPGPEMDQEVYRVLVERLGWRTSGGYLYKPNGDCPNATEEWRPSVLVGDALELVDAVRATFEFRAPLWRRSGRIPYEAAFESCWAGGETKAEAIARAFLKLFA